jgi:ADP-heptose:LPS heptosyltransferase
MKNNPGIQFYMGEGTVIPDEYCQQFFQFLCKQTDCFSLVPGKQELPWKNVNLWDYRDICGDVVKIYNDKEMKKKIVVFPIYDALYHVYRNWPMELFHKVLAHCSAQYPDHEKIVCVKDIPDPRAGINLHDFKLSTDFMTNIKHIMDAEIFIGGDTGVSHFAAALDRGPKELVYYYSSRGMLHTTPFYALQGKGILNTYWLDCEGVTWE